MSNSKALSFDERSILVRRALYDALNNPSEEFWIDVVDVYEDYAVICVRPAKYYQVPYTIGGAEVTFANPDEWTVVEKEWVAAKATLYPMAIVKAITVGDEWALDVLGNPFGSAQDKDADGEYFDSTTNFHFDEHQLPVVITHHGLNPETGEWDESVEYVGKAVSVEIRTDGVWYRVILDKASETAKGLWESANRGLLRASTGSIPQLARVSKGGHVSDWPVVELSLIDLTDRFLVPKNRHAVAMPAAKAMYEKAGLTLPPFISDGEKPEAGRKGKQQSAPAEPERLVTNVKLKGKKDIEVDEKELQKQIAEGVAAAMKAQREADAAEAKAKADEEARIKAEVDKRLAEKEAELMKGRRLPYSEEAANDYGVPYVARYQDLWRYDNLEPGDQALMVATLKDARLKGLSRNGASEMALKALAVKMAEDKSDDPSAVAGRWTMMKAQMPMKANEIMQSTLTSFGDEWVDNTFSQRIWEKIRIATWVLNRIPTIEFTPGMGESITIPLESTGATFYKVAQVANLNATTGRPDANVPSSQTGTAQKTLTLGKVGARQVWSGEMEEDSMIPFVTEIRRQLEIDGQEQLEHLIIDGDTETGATTNINDIGGTPAGNELFLVLNGFRKLALVTNTANGRSAGALTAEDFLETLKLMGVEGSNAIDMTRVEFILDLPTNWKALELPEVKTRDVNVQATVENGKLRNMWGYNVNVSAQMHRAANTTRRANTSGKVDRTTPSNNTTGSILGVRYDQWLLGWKRRATIEVSRYPESDANQIVMLMRLGMTNRDNEASAISYGTTL